MATVPVATQQVQPSGRGPVYQSISGANNLASFGGDTTGFDRAATALESAGKGIADAVVRQQIEDNEREAKKLDIALSERLRKINYGDGTNENPGFLSAKGEDALKNANAARDAIKQAVTDVSGTTKSERVQTLFGDMARIRAEQELGTVDRHVQQQRIIADDTISHARLSEAASDAAANYTDPTVMERSLAVANGEIQSQAKRNGWGPEVVKAKLSEAKSVIIGEAVKSALAAENVEVAVKTFNDNATDLDAKTRVALAAALQAQTVTKQGQSIADKLFAKHGGDIQAALAELQQIATGKSRDAAWEHYNSIINSIHAGVHFQQGQQDRFDPNGGTLAQRAFRWGQEQLQQRWTEQEHARTVEERQRIETVRKAEDEWVSKIMRGDPVNPADVAADERLASDPAKKATLLSMIRTADRGEPIASVSRKTAVDLFNRINLPDGDPNKITDETDINAAFADGKLSKADLDWTRKQFADARTPEGTKLGTLTKKFLDGYKSQITDSSLIKVNKEGDGSFYIFSQYVTERLNAARAAGEDPYELLKPGSPKYLGSPETLRLFQNTMADSLKALTENLQRTTGGEALKYKTLEELKQAVDDKKVDRATAETLARAKGWIK